MGVIKAIKHYAIPPKCENDPPKTCPAVDNIDLSGLVPKAWESRYDELELNEGNRLRTEQTGGYTPQGGCTDGVSIYRALVENDDQPTKLQKLDMMGNIILERTDTSYGHANDMTYCAKDGLLYIAHSSSTSIVYKVDPINLTLVDTIDIGRTIWGIDYNATDDLFILGGVGDAYLSVYTYDFNFMYRIKPNNAFTGMVRQGITSNDNYIFVSLDNAYGTILENEKGSRIAVYTWNGLFIKMLHLDIKEIEFAALHENNLIIGTYEGRDQEDVKSGELYKVTFDLYPGQTNITGRPTDVSGGLNNLQRLPEGTPIRLWRGTASNGSVTLKVPSRMAVNENEPFRTLKFYFKGANQQIFEWKPMNTGTVALREIDITEAVEDTTIRIREARLTYNPSTKTFTFESNQLQELKHDFSEDKITFTKDKEGTLASLIELTEIWGII